MAHPPSNRPAFSVTMILVLSSVGCRTPAVPTRMEESFHWRPAPAAVGWAVFLPGASGLRILDDDHHYLDVARRLNNAGWSVLLVDYKPAYHAGHGPEGSTAEKIAWVTVQAVTWLHREHPETQRQPGALIGWSLGTQGVFELIQDPVRVGPLGFRCAVAYYPFQPPHPPLNNRLPLLVLSGRADSVSPAPAVAALGTDRPSGAETVEIQLYPGAEHGFDVASLTRRTTVRALPWIGPSATLQYDAVAARDAESRMLEFLVRESR